MIRLFFLDNFYELGPQGVKLYMKEKETLELSRFEYAVSYNEAELSKKREQSDLRQKILFHIKPAKKKKAFKWLRIRSFFIKHKKFKRLMEFSIHPTGIHMLRLAIYHSDNGCNMCKVYVEKNLF